jgi:1-acyl-sn-glycerol-3-phosphate acyltransferase
MISVYNNLQMHWVYYFGRGLIHILVFPFAWWRVKGRENITSPGPFIVVCNHLHIVDPPIIAASLPLKCVLMAKEELWHNRWSRFWVKNFGAFPVRRGGFDRAAIRQAEYWLKKGVSVIMFPEGTRSPDARMIPALPGAALIAQRMGVPVLPVSITGTEKLRHLTWCLIHHPRITITFGGPFSLPPSNGKMAREQRQEMMDGIMRKVAALLPPEYRGVYGTEKTAGN